MAIGEGIVCMKWAVLIRSLQFYLSMTCVWRESLAEVEGLLRCRLVLLEVLSMLTTRIRNSNKFINGPQMYNCLTM